MARRRRSSRAQRDTSVIANERLLDAELLGPVSPSSTLSVRSVSHDWDYSNPHSTWSSSFLTEVEDRRTWHPEAAFRPPLLFSGNAARFDRLVDRRSSPLQVRRGLRVRSQTKAVRAFDDPGYVALCVRRKKRREVIFAKRKAGKGSRRRHRRRNYFSEIRC